MDHGKERRPLLWSRVLGIFTVHWNNIKLNLLSICFASLFCAVAKINFLNVKSEQDGGCGSESLQCYGATVSFDRHLYCQAEIFFFCLTHKYTHIESQRLWIPSVHSAFWTVPVADKWAVPCRDRPCDCSWHRTCCKPGQHSLWPQKIC